MKAANPFQVPGYMTGNPQFTGRERFKKIFLAVLAAHVLLFLTLLIQGCRTGQKASSVTPDGSALASQN